MSVADVHSSTDVPESFSLKELAESARESFTEAYSVKPKVRAEFRETTASQALNRK